MAGVRRGQGRAVALAAALLGTLLFVVFIDLPAWAQNEFAGIGVRVTMEGGLVKVVAPIEGSPAAKAGIIAGDFITRLDLESLQGLTLPEAINKMRGPINSTVKLTIIREGQDKPIEVTLVRSTIEVDRSVLYDRPVLVIDPGMHTGGIYAASVDAAERFVATGSLDKTVRVWSIDDGRLLQTIRVPAGPKNVGEVRAVAMSPDGNFVAVGGANARDNLPLQVRHRRDDPTDRGRFA
jgi:hypothetical protein